MKTNLLTYYFPRSIILILLSNKLFASFFRRFIELSLIPSLLLDYRFLSISFNRLSNFLFSKKDEISLVVEVE